MATQQDPQFDAAEASLRTWHPVLYVNVYRTWRGSPRGMAPAVRGKGQASANAR